MVVGRELAVEGNVVALPKHHFLEILRRKAGVKCSYLGYWFGKLLHSFPAALTQRTSTRYLSERRVGWLSLSHADK